MSGLEAIDVSKIFSNGDRELRALDHVSLAVEEGDLAAVMGASGSGKSTLLYILGGLEYPSAGRVIVNGVDITELSEEDRTMFRLYNIGFVFQDYNLVPVINVLENIALPARLAGRRVDLNEIESLAEKLGIMDKLYAMPGSLSGGQQQRTAVARALYTRPKILLADEPTGNLDSQTGMETICLMKDLCRAYGQTMIVVTHDERVAGMTGRVISIADGRIVEQDGKSVSCG